MNFLKNHLSFATICCIASCLTPNAQAVNLVVNGGFETTSNGAGKQIGTTADPAAKFTTLTGWYTTDTVPTVADPTSYRSFNLVFASGTAETTGAANRFSNATGTSNKVTFWGTDNPADAAHPRGAGPDAIPNASPSGGNFVALDGGFDIGALNQQMSGLTIGQNYELSFSWAVAQQYDKDAAAGLTEKLIVKLGGQTIETPTVSYPDHGFKGWFQQTMIFKADSTSPILSFLSAGTPTGQPPFALLDGVSLQAVPEPSSCLIGSLTLAGLILRRRRTATNI